MLMNVPSVAASAILANHQRLEAPGDEERGGCDEAEGEVVGGAAAVGALEGELIQELLALDLEADVAQLLRAAVSAGQGV